MSAQELRDEALKLPVEAREWLAQELWNSLDSQDDPQFLAELNRRWEEIVKGKVQTVPHEEVMTNARQAIQKVREKKAVSSGS